MKGYIQLPPLFFKEMQSSNDNFCLHLLTAIKDSFGNFSMSYKPWMSKYSDHFYFMDNFKNKLYAI